MPLILMHSEISLCFAVKLFSWCDDSTSVHGGCFGNLGPLEALLKTAGTLSHAASMFLRNTKKVALWKRSIPAPLNFAYIQTYLPNQGAPAFCPRSCSDMVSSPKSSASPRRWGEDVPRPSIGSEN